jgi:hypothetical protein
MGPDKKTRAEVDQKVAEEKPPRSVGELSGRGFEAWATSAGLNENQKSKMTEIQIMTEREALRIRDEINKSKSALFKELAKGNYDERMINGFKSKIVKLDHERLELMFKALAKTRNVLGQSEESKKYFEYMEMIETRDIAGPRY